MEPLDGKTESKHMRVKKSLYKPPGKAFQNKKERQNKIARLQKKLVNVEQANKAMTLWVIFPTKWKNTNEHVILQCLWRREWQPIPAFLPGESHRQRCLDGYSPWGRKELDTIE